MKNQSQFIFPYIIFLSIFFSCNKTEPKKEVPEEINNPKLREVTGGTPDETTALVIGSFKSDEKDCKSGFGLCSLTFTNPTAQYPDSTRKNPNDKTYKAIFYLGTSDDSLKIEFDQAIPHAQDFLSIGKSDTITNVLGHAYIIPAKGKYRFIKDTKSKYGRVVIKVTKGEKKSIYKNESEKEKTQGH